MPSLNNTVILVKGSNVGKSECMAAVPAIVGLSLDESTVIIGSDSWPKSWADVTTATEITPTLTVRQFKNYSAAFDPPPKPKFDTNIYALLPGPERNKPCSCGSGRKRKHCCK